MNNLHIENAEVVMANLHSVEAEQAVIGGLMLDNTAWAKMGDLSDKAFYSMPHRLIYRAILNLLNNNRPVDLVTVQELLEQHGKLEEVGGLAYLVTIYQNTPSAANIARYAEILRERHALRGLLEVAQKVADLAVERDGVPVADKQAQAMQLMTDAVTAGSKRGNGKTYAEGLCETIGLIDMNGQRKKGELLGFSTGLKPLDVMTNGLQRGWLSVLAARPSMGKSVLAENIGRSAAKQGLKVRYQSYEMGVSELQMRGLAAEAGVLFERVQNGEMSESEWDGIRMATETLMNVDFVIDDTGLRIDELLAECRLMKQQNGLDVLVIDHLHIMPRPRKNDVQELAEITGKLKGLAMELNIHVLLVAQLSRNVESRPDKRPVMSDIRDSGGIEQDANLIIFPYRHAYYDKSHNPTEAELIIAKNRNGKQGTCFVGFFGDYQRFENHADPTAQPPKPVIDDEDEWAQ